jgi:cobalamin biosynthesis protein CobW
MGKIPVTVITGFLGAGKTTLVRHLLQENQGRRIAVLVNEFGEVGIDGDLIRSCQVCEEDEFFSSSIVELTNGCLCCTVQEEFLPTMQELLKRRDQIDCIVIETSGLALPKPLVQAFRWPEIRTGATVDGVLTVVDCEALARGALVGDLEALEAQRQEDESLDHETPIEELFEDQLNCADMVLLSKADLVDPDTRERVESWLRSQLRPGVQILPCHQGQLDPVLLLGFNAAVEDHLHTRPSHHDTEEEHDHDDQLMSFSMTPDLELDPTGWVRCLQQLVQEHEIYRIKGFAAVPGKRMRLVIQGVGPRFETYYDRPWRTDEIPQTRLVVIGRALDQDYIEKTLHSVANAPVSV